MRTTYLFIGDENGLRDFSPGRPVRKSTAAFDKEYGRSIKLNRKAAGVTQLGLAELIGIHPVTLSRIETATIPVTPKLRARIDDALRSLEG